MLVKRLVGALGFALALCAAPPVHADPDADANASFVDALAKAGITFNDRQNAINAGRTTCELLDKGKSQMDVVQLVMQQNSDISTVSAAKFTAIATSAYCPKYLKHVADDGPQQ